MSGKDENSFLLDVSPNMSTAMPGALSLSHSLNPFNALREALLGIDLTQLKNDSRDSVLTAINTILNFLKKFDRKKWLTRTDFFREAYSVAPAAFVIYSCTTDGGLHASLGMIISLCLVAVWDFPDVASAMLTAPDYFERAKQDPTLANKFIAWSNIIFYPCVLGILTASATYSIIMSASEKCSAVSFKDCFDDVIVKSKTTEGDPIILAMNDFAYGGGALLAAIYQLLSENNSSIKKRAAIAGNLMCFIGAMLGGLSMLLEPKGYVYASAVFYALYAIIKETLLLLGSAFFARCSQSLFGAKESVAPSPQSPSLNNADASSSDYLIVAGGNSDHVDGSSDHNDTRSRSGSNHSLSSSDNSTIGFFDPSKQVTAATTPQKISTEPEAREGDGAVDDLSRQLFP